MVAFISQLCIWGMESSPLQRNVNAGKVSHPQTWPIFHIFPCLDVLNTYPDLLQGLKNICKVYSVSANLRSICYNKKPGLTNT